MLFLLFLGAWSGYKKGLLMEIVTFLALIIGIITAFHLLKKGIEYIAPYFSGPESVIPFISFILIFIIMFAGVLLLGKILKKLLDIALLGKFDSLAGAALGACKYAFLLSLIFWLINSAGISFPENYISGSFLYPGLIDFAPRMVSWVSYLIPFQDIFPAVKNLLQSYSLDSAS